MIDPSNALLIMTGFTAFVLLSIVATHTKLRTSATEIVLKLERAGSGPISQLAFKDGKWTANVFRDSKRLEIIFDEITGRIVAEHEQRLRERPPRDAMPLSKILEPFAPSSVQEIDFEKGRWEIEYEKDGIRRESIVDPVNGGIISDQRAA